MQFVLAPHYLSQVEEAISVLVKDPVQEVYLQIRNLPSADCPPYQSPKFLLAESGFAVPVAMLCGTCPSIASQPEILSRQKLCADT